MKVIILAAGRGSRMKRLTRYKPKCLIEFQGKSILQTQREVFHEYGIDDIVVIKGYLEHLINIDGLRYYIDNDCFNMLHTLFCAENELEGDVIISYGDILFEKWVLCRLLLDKHDISVVVDVAWKNYFSARFGDPYSEAESLVLDSNNRIHDIGAPSPTPEKVQAQYIGLIKLSDTGCKMLKSTYHLAKETSSGKKWQTAKIFEYAYMTDMLQSLVKSGYEVYGVPIRNGWLEFDTICDYEKYLIWDRDGTLSNFYDRTR